MRGDAGLIARFRGLRRAERRTGGDALSLILQGVSRVDAGVADTDEGFVIYRSTGQILWALVDGAGEPSIGLQMGGTTVGVLA